LPELLAWISEAVTPLNLTYEIIIVDDGSRDNSPKVLRELKKKYPPLKAIVFRKNYGKSAALSEGFRLARGEIVITMDADLQDDPGEIPNMLRKLNEGYDLVSGWKKKRNDPISKKLPSKLFNFVTSLVTGIRLHDFNCGLKAYRREVIETIQVYGEMHRFLPVLAHWQGFRVGELAVKHHPRVYGKTKFGLRRFFNGFLDLLTVLFLTRYKTSPLHIFGMMGLFFFLIGFVIEVYFTIHWSLGGKIGTRPLFFLGILLIIVGVQFIVFGLLGEMLTADFAEKVQYTRKEIIE
ncbi:MAG: glycosyltransferase family 2 protein, partial [Calditrichia bacterium]